MKPKLTVDWEDYLTSVCSHCGYPKIVYAIKLNDKVSVYYCRDCAHEYTWDG